MDASRRLVEKYIRTTEILNYEGHCQCYFRKGAGYLTKMDYIHGKDRDTSENHYWILKYPGDIEVLRNRFAIRELFVNEIHFYSNILPALKELRNFEFIPSMLYYTQECGKEGIVLKNVKTPNFIYDNYIHPNGERILTKLMIETLGSFHAYSCALQQKNEEKYLKLIKGCMETPLESFGKLDNFVEFSDYLRKLCELDTFYTAHKPLWRKALEKLREYEKDTAILGSPDKSGPLGSASSCQKSMVKNNLDRVKELQARSARIQSDTTWPLKKTGTFATCILRGNSWRRDSLIGYAQNSNDPIEVRMIDFQFVTWGNPMVDIFNCLFTYAPKVEWENYIHYLYLYFWSFTETMNQLDCDTSGYKMEKLLEDWQEFIVCGIMMTKNRDILMDLIKMLKQELVIPPDFDDDGTFKERIIKNLI